MLTKQQNQKNESVIKLLCKLHIIPFYVENDFQIYSKKTCRVWYGLITGGMLHTSYIVVQLVISAIENYSELRKGASSGETLIHAGIALGSVLIYSNVIMLFLRPHDRDQTSSTSREIYAVGQIEDKKNTENDENSAQEPADAGSTDEKNRNQYYGGNKSHTNGVKSMVVRKIHVKPIKKPTEVNEEDKIIVLPEEPKQERELQVLQLTSTSKRLYNDAEQEPGPSNSFFKMLKHEFLGWAAGPLFLVILFNCLFGLALYSDSRQLIYYMVPHHFKGPVVFYAFFLIEIIAKTFVISHAFFMTLMKVLVLQKVDLRLSKIEKALKSGIHLIGVACTKQEQAQNQSMPIEYLNQMITDLKKAGILVDLYNNLLCWVVCVTKNGTTTVAIICGYFSIRFLHTDPMISVIGLLLSCSCSIVIALLYDVGLNLKYRKERIVKEILFQGALAGVNARREVCCIRAFGIKVGNFRMLPRNTTPAVIHYIITETAGYVIMFQ